MSVIHNSIILNFTTPKLMGPYWLWQRWR